jgi:SAM-dependent methyltransferase
VKGHNNRMPLYVHYGCGLTAPDGWINFDSSPTLIIQKIPLLGRLAGKSLNVIFPSNVRYGDIVKGLPVRANSCDGIYCSHVLEHLSRNDFLKALQNSYSMLKPGGIFRLVVPDLESYIREYERMKADNDPFASVTFMEQTLLGEVDRPQGLKRMISYLIGNSRHLWMWDEASIREELKKCGFMHIRKAHFNDCVDKAFLDVENGERFENALCMECRK